MDHPLHSPSSSGSGPSGSDAETGIDPGGAPPGAARHRRPGRWPLLPDDPELGWTPYLWLVYLGFPLIFPAFGPGTTLDWAVALGSMVVFLPFYFWGYWLSGHRLLVPVAVIFALGAGVSTINPGGSTYFIYAAAFLAWIGPPSRSLRWLAAHLGAIGLLAWVVPYPAWTWIPAVVFSAIIGAVNIHQREVAHTNSRLRLARDEVERLAKAAERERIARDLHDLLGHTLSVIAVKSELAGKLVDRDRERAGREIREVHGIAREALAEVRRAVRGYRESDAGLVHELGNARRALAAAAIELEVEGDPEELARRLGAAREAILSLALREAVTNVVRHADADRCRVRLEATRDAARLVVADDGRGGLAPEGSGLTGMRERLEALGGRLLRDGSDGTRLTLVLPLAEERGDERRRAGTAP